MVKIVNSDLFESDADIIIVTTNGYINGAGELVMGSGAASQLKNMYPDIPRRFAQAIRAKGFGK